MKGQVRYLRDCIVWGIRVISAANIFYFVYSVEN